MCCRIFFAGVSTQPSPYYPTAHSICMIWAKKVLPKSIYTILECNFIKTIVLCWCDMQGPQKNCLELRFYMKHPNGDALCKKFQTVFVRKSNLWFILPSHWFRGKITLHSISLNLKMTNAIILFPSRTSKYFLYQIIVRFLFRILVPLCNSGLKFWQEPNLHGSLFQAKHHVSNPSVRYRFFPCVILVPSK